MILLLVCMPATLAVAALPLRQIVASRLREPFFLAWSGMLVVNCMGRTERAALLRCRTMATVPQRELRNDTAGLLRRVAAGETVRITSSGRAVADLVPVERAATFVSLGDVVSGIGGVLRPDDRLDEELREVDLEPTDPFV